jgi:hypothetical protein
MRTETTKPCRQVTFNQDAATGLVEQNAASSESSIGWAADGDIQMGGMQVWMVKHVAAADQAVDSAGAIIDIPSTKAARGQSYRILKVETVLRSLRTGGTPDHDWKLQKGDGAASEAFSDIVASVDFDADTDETPTVRLPIVAQTLVESGKTLRSQMSVAGTTTGATAELDVLIYVIPVNA